jgi:hypothetical protein
MEDSLEVKKVKKKVDKAGEAAKGAAKGSRKKKKVTCITIFVIGVIMLVVGIVFLVLSILKGSSVADGEYLVEAGDWTLTDCKEDDCDKVIWDFTEIGKGVLTTDGGEHKYEFKWAIKDGKLIVHTDWLYEIDDEYEYSLDQGGKALTLKTDDNEYRFTAQ